MISLMQLNPGIFSAAFIQLFICFYSALLASQGYQLSSFSAAYILVDFQIDHQLLLLAVALPRLAVSNKKRPRHQLPEVTVLELQLQEGVGVRGRAEHMASG